MTWVVQREIALAGGGTVFDPNPATTQPGEFAVDGAAAQIPMVIRTGGQVWGDIIVVDASGAPQPVGAETFDLAFVKRTASDVLRSGGTSPSQRFVWNRGVVSTAQAPAIEQTQAGMEKPAGVVLVVLAGVNVPGSGRLLVRIWEGAR